FGNAHQYIKPPMGRVSGEVFPLLGSELAIAVSTGLNNAKERSGRMIYRGVRTPESAKTLEVKIEPIFEKISQRTYFMVSITEESNITPVGELPLSREIDFSLSEETAEYVHQLQAELQRTKEALQTSAEELETSNEELQASNEELLASNEELQSTNEELHSVNEELFTVNSEHEHKILELDRISGDLRNLVNSSELAMIFLDKQLQIRIFTPKATDVFHLVYQDIGRDIRHFMPKVQDPDLFNDLSEVIEKGNTQKRFLKGNQADTFFERSCHPFSLANDIEGGVVLSYRDISEFVRVKFTSELFDISTQTEASQFLVLDEAKQVIGHFARGHKELEQFKKGDHLERILSTLKLQSEENLTEDADKTVKVGSNSKGHSLLAEPVIAGPKRGWLLHLQT
ncbi:MAG: PAS domain-containing protein, partial [Limnobacter sp.]|nr:PAS domain-containing protein [Limnobacter sp.]